MNFPQTPQNIKVPGQIVTPALIKTTKAMLSQVDTPGHKGVMVQSQCPPKNQHQPYGQTRQQKGYNPTNA